MCWVANKWEAEIKILGYLLPISVFFLFSNIAIQHDKHGVLVEE